MLFTHFGVSGPLVLSASCHMQPDKDGSPEPLPPVHRLEARPERAAAGCPNPCGISSSLSTRILSTLGLLLPKRASKSSQDSAGFRLKLKSIKSPAQRTALIQVMKAMPLTPEGIPPHRGGHRHRRRRRRGAGQSQNDGIQAGGRTVFCRRGAGRRWLHRRLQSAIAFSTGFAAGTYC